MLSQRQCSKTQMLSVVCLLPHTSPNNQTSKLIMFPPSLLYPFISSSTCQSPLHIHLGNNGIAGGITLHGFKFMAVRADADEVIGRKGEKGVFILPTQQAILVAEVSHPLYHQAPGRTGIVSKLGIRSLTI